MNILTLSALVFVKCVYQESKLESIDDSVEKVSSRRF